MSIAAFILGIISIIMSFIPICGSIAFFPATISIVLGIVDIVKRKKEHEPLILAIIGVVLSALSLFIIIAWIFIIIIFGDDDIDSNNDIIDTNPNSTYTENTTETNPILGNWLGEGENVGYFEFKQDNTFYWYLNKDDLDDNYFSGRYIVTKGAQQNNGNIDYGTSGKEIYTINLYYSLLKMDGVETYKSYTSMFIIQRRSENQFIVRNMSTDGIFTINRIS